MADADASFERLAGAALDDVLTRHPDMATELGDHRFDTRLPDSRPEALEDERRALSGQLRELSALDGALSADNRVDAEILRSQLEGRLYELEVLRDHEWSPLLANPGGALYSLLARDFAPLPERLRSLAARLGEVPASLDVARRSLRDMPRVHLETAIGQFAGTAALIAEEVDRALGAAPELRPEIDLPRPAALAAIQEHQRWLSERLASLEGPGPDPRIGPERFARKLAYTLDAATDSDQILARAEEELARAEEEIASTAARLGEAPASTPGLVRGVLDQLAEDRPDNATILELCRRSLAEAGEFVAERGLVTMYDDPVEVIVMPEFHRGVAVAYCDPPGPLETASLPTFFAVSPTPADWPAARVASFFREYNRHMVHDLTVHEGIPGHALQLAHARRFRGATPLRAGLWSGPFVEGWAVYAERLMVEHGYRDDGLRMQRLKMQLRTILNAILDARVHAHGMTEDEAMRLMLERGHQEEGEAAGKWRRALLSSTQLSTYFVGFIEVSDLARDLATSRPAASERELHDQMLAHGSPPPRHLRTLLGL